MKIVFLRTYDFPHGGAPQNRLLGICRGLIAQAADVEVHVYAPAKLNIPENHKKFQTYKSVPIFNHASRWSPVKRKFDQVFGLFLGLITSILGILKSHRVNKIDYFFINTENNFYILPYFFLAKLLGVKLGRDLNEYPKSVLNPGIYTKGRALYKLNTNYRWFDVIFVITKNLEKYYKPLAGKKTRFLLLPVTVDFDRFPEPVKDIANNRHITYVGDLSQSKDGVLTLIRAFALIQNEFPEHNLKLIGSNNDKNYMNLLAQTIEELSLQARIILTGYMNPEDIPCELYKARLLVLSRPDNIQAKGGFPTKLGEYLATGVPVAVTRVGELPLYLTDNKNAFLADPDSIESFADAMKRALLNTDNAAKVGIAGREIAKLHFAHSSQGKMLFSFLKGETK
jgi:glycosyltransferase involved in cell wall biosynthesis